MLARNRIVFLKRFIASPAMFDVRNVVGPIDLLVNVVVVIALIGVQMLRRIQRVGRSGTMASSKSSADHLSCALAAISREDQQAQIIEATLGFLAGYK